MKKFALQMLMIVMAFAISQASWADNNGKENKGKVRPKMERRGFNKAKMDSIRAAHPNFRHRPQFARHHMHRPFGPKMDSMKVRRPMTKAEVKDMMDSLKVANPRLAHRIMHHHFAHRHFPRRHFPHRPGWKKHEPVKDATAESVAPAEVKAADATAITDIKQTSTSTKTYDLNGRPVSGQNGRGIVIRNGKKYVK